MTNNKKLLIAFNLTPDGQVKASVPGKRVFCSRMNREITNVQIFAFDDPALRLPSLMTDAQWVKFLDGESIEIEGSLSTLQYDTCDSIIEEWSREWPIEPGQYWFYGWLHSNSEEPEMYFAYLSTYKNHFVLIEDNSDWAPVMGSQLYVIHPSHARGLWVPVVGRCPPSDELLAELEEVK